MPTVEYLSYEVVEEEGWDVRDGENFDRAAEMDLTEEEYGEFDVDEDEYILEAAEDTDLDWPFECRAGTCATCAAILVDGEVEMDVPPIISQSEIDDGVRLTCIGLPRSDRLRMVHSAQDSDLVDILL